MACEIFMLNSSSNELGIIKFLSTSVFSGETFSFFSQRLSVLSPSKSSAKTALFPFCLCDTDHRKPAAGSFSPLWLLQQCYQWLTNQYAPLPPGFSWAKEVFPQHRCRGSRSDSVCVGVGLCRCLSCSLSHQPCSAPVLLKSSGGQ